MEDDDDDFTFPTVAVPARAPAPEGQLGLGGPAAAHLRLHQLPLPDLAAASSPLWPFAGAPKPTAPSSSPPEAKDKEAPPVSSGSTARAVHRAEAGDDQEQEDRRVAADEERMDLLWEDDARATTTTTAPAPQSTGSGAGHAEAEPPEEPNPEQRRAEADDVDKQRGAASMADAERMDKLWESFNEELLLLRRARSKSAAAADRPGSKDWYLCSYPPSEDADSEGTSAWSPAGYGCTPTMLRASSRAGGVGQFCSSPRSRRRSSRGWALLLRLFRRIFAVDKTPASRTHASIYVP